MSSGADELGQEDYREAQQAETLQTMRGVAARESP
jgi:hypothetical protein